MKILFVCTSNKDRSPALEKHFREKYPEHEYRSAGINHYFTSKKGTHEITKEDVDWCDYLICAEKIHYEFIFKNLLMDFGKPYLIISAGNYDAENMRKYVEDAELVIKAFLDWTDEPVMLNESISDAIISDCGKYRYALTRIWDSGKPKVMFVMLNPSTADAHCDDATIRRCISFAKSWGYGGIYVCNLFAFRATDPKELLSVDNPFGDKNIWHTRQLSDKVDVIVCAWGNKRIVDAILKKQNPLELLGYALPKLYYLELSKDKEPKHPLYLRRDVKPKPMYQEADKNTLPSFSPAFDSALDGETDIIQF